MRVITENPVTHRPVAGVSLSASSDDLPQGWAVERYEILPDRIVLYLWPTAGGTDVQFSFTPRLAMKALSSQSVLFDYYNPEALVVLPPSSFDVARSTNKMSLSEMEDQ